MSKNNNTHGELTDTDIAETDIAIIGIGLRAPGARNYREFWNNLCAGIESVRRYSEEELLAAGESRAALRAKNYVPAGAPLDDMEWFDGEFFGFSPKESAILDPQHRHFYECVWEALEDAACPPEKFSGPIGVFAGCGMGSYFYFNICSNPGLLADTGLFLLRHTGNDKDFLATRVSYLLNLTGPSVNVQTACSTSLVAVHLACQSLLQGECSLAIAGGVTIELPHRRGYHFRENEILSPDGHCHPFDHRAKGTVFGSGAACVVLRPLQAALRDGDPIHAVIRGSAINNDGARKAGYLAPSVDGQAAAVAEALAIADVSADSIGYVEAHGTGTYLGDPIEVAALTQAYSRGTTRRGYCQLGSVKSNIGHTDTAAGVIGLIKAALSVEHGLIVPSINFEKPNPTIDFDASPFRVANTLLPWPKDLSPRRAGVNSLGVGGTNAHVILQEPPARRVPGQVKTGPELLCLSARNITALDGACERLAAHLEAHPELSLADVAFTLKEGRRDFDKRRVLAVADREEAIALLRRRDRERVWNHTVLASEPTLYFMFPGGGAQYPNMARGLYDREPEFRKVIDDGLAWLSGRMDVELRDVLFPAPGQIEAARVAFKRPSVQLPAIYLVEYGLARLLMARGFTPRGLLGHSLGENTAAALAGVFSFEEGLGLVLLRGQLFDGVPAGGMLSVPLSEAELKPLLGDSLDLACINAPGLTVASGPDEALRELAARLAERDVQAQRIGIDIAAHSRMLEGILARFGDYLRGLKLAAPRIPFLSNRTGTWISDTQATDPEYWVGHLRNTVRFSDCVATLARERAPILLEVGPGRTLGSLCKQNPGVNPQAVLSSLRHPDENIDDATHFLTVLGRLWALGLPLTASALWGESGSAVRRRVFLPTYAFTRQRYWIEAGRGQERSAAEEPDLSRQPDIEKWFYRPKWVRQDVEVSGASERSSEESTRWLVFVDEARIGRAVVARLQKDGDEVVTVEPGDAFAKLDDHRYRLSPEFGRAGYEALVRDLLASGKAPAKIVHAWLLAEEERFRPGSTFFHRNQERGFYSLLFLAQALAAEEYPRPVKVWVLSQGMHSIRNQPVAYPEQATVLGPCKLIPRELPGFECVSIDLPGPARAQTAAAGLLDRAKTRVLEFVRSRVQPAAAATDENGVLVDGILRELRLPGGGEKPERIVALRGDTRWVMRYERAALDAGRPTRLRERGVYLVTGGFGGIGLTLARALAREQKARLILLGRVPLPDRKEWDIWLGERPSDPASARIRAVRELEGLGAEVLAEAADVTDAGRVAQVLADVRARFSALHGVIHAAGSLDDGPILAKRQIQVENVFAPKVHGTLVLDRALRDAGAYDGLDFFVVFSSTSVAIAPPGQVDYVAANAFLEAFADARRAEGKPVQALSWGVWSQVGMAAETARRLGIGSADGQEQAPARGYPLFARLRAGVGGGWVLEGTFDARRDWMLSEHRTAAGEAVLPGTGYVEILRAALDELEPGHAFELRDLYFFRPLPVADDEPRAFRVRVTVSDEGYELALQSRYRVEAGGSGDLPTSAVEGWALHAQARGVARDAPIPATVDVAVIDARCQAKRLGDGSSGLRLLQEEHLRFGPRWRVLQRIAVGDGEALAYLALPQECNGDLALFKLHPALLDMATGFALEHLYPSTGQALWVPLSYGRLRVHAPLRERIVSWVRRSKAKAATGFACFDVVLMDELGNVLVEIEGFTMRRLADGMAFGLDVSPAIVELERDDGARGRELSSAEESFRRTLEEGVTPADGVRAFARVLAHPEEGRLLCSSLDLHALVRQADAFVAEPVDKATRFARPELNSAYVAPRTDVEKTLVAFWQELLGVDQVGVTDSFFDLGGHSLIAVRLFARIKKAFNVDYPISVLFEAPTIEACARLIGESGTSGTDTGGSAATKPGARAEAHPTRYRYLVPMHEESAQLTGRTPFFLVAGMFGNVLNLRHLAHLVGADRPFYGLQARGLYGDQAPHETFEEMARDYLVEMRAVQPHGPYILGGFSGGGITAYEMARQLLAEGERVPLIVLLDTPLPNDRPLNLRERLTIQRQKLAARGVYHIADWWRGRQAYKRVLRERASAGAQVAKGDADQARPAGPELQSKVIEAAFYRACERYRVVPLPVRLALFRPRLRPAHVLGPGQAINEHRRRIYHDNGWAPFVKGIEVFEVPGDHDGMVLEPNVRVLAVKLRRSLEVAERERSDLAQPLVAAQARRAEESSDAGRTNLSVKGKPDSLGGASA